MSSVGELSVGVSCDPSEFTAGMTKVRDEVQQTTTVVIRQQSGWQALAGAAISASASLTGTAVNFAIETKKMSAEWTRFAITTTLAGAAVLGIAAPATTAKVAIAGGTAALIYHNQWLLKLVGFAVPGWGQIAAAVSLGITAYKAATFAINDTASAFQGSIDGTGESILGYNRLHGATGRLSASMSELGSSIVKPFSDGTSAIYNYVASFSPLPSLAGITASAFDGLSSAANYVASGLKSATATATTAAFIIATGASHDASAAFTEQGIALEKLSAQTTAFIAKQEAARASFQSLKSIQENAADTAKNAAEVAKVASILTVEGIDQSIAALREKSAATIMAGDAADKAWEQQTASLFNALEKQRQGIIDGTVVDQDAVKAKAALAKTNQEIEQTINSAKDAALKLAVGENEVAVAALRAKGATDEQIAALQGWQQAASDTKTKQDELKKSAELDKTGKDKIAELTDQIGLLDGSATNASIAMRKMQEAGFSNEQIEQVAKLTNELDRLKEEEKDAKKKDPKEKSGPTALKAAFQGSSEAASIMLSGVGGGKSIEDIAGKQLTVAQQQLAATKANKPQPMTAIADFGAGA